jgi:hypothetical protein
MNSPTVLKEVLKPDLFLNVAEDVDRDWSLLNGLTTDKGPCFWGKEERTSPILIHASSIIKLKLMRVLECHINLIRIQINGQTSGQTSSFHQDFGPEGVWTFIFFTATAWNVDWGGEFVCQVPSTQEFSYTPYVPNNGVLIPSNWWHKGSSPNHSTNYLRTSVAFSFATDEVLERFRKEGEVVTEFI